MSQDSGAEVGAVTKDGDAELVKDYHVNTPEPTEEHKAAEVAFLTEMERWKRWGEIEDTVKARITYDAQRILRARNFNINNSVVLAQQTAEFFSVEKPFGIGPEEMEKEAATGKVRLGGIDRHHRPVVVLDNTVENTTEQSGQMRFRLFNMEYSILHMKPPVEKQVVFINLEAFSIWNAPALSTRRSPSIFLQNTTANGLGLRYCGNHRRILLYFWACAARSSTPLRGVKSSL